MFPVLVIALTLSLIVVFLVLLFAFLDVAFAGPRAADAGGRAKPEWQPPLIQGDELFAWAAAAAQSTVRRCLPATRGAATAQAIAGDVSAGMAYAVERSPRQVQRRADHACSSCRCQMIAVTAPEVLAIVEAIRAKRPDELRRVRDRARENAARAADMDPQQYEAAKIVCPLLCDNACAANGSRPLHCRGWLRLSDQEGDAAPLSQGALGQGAVGRGATHIDRHVYTVSQGVKEGLSRELSLQGLDGARYELSSALTVALDTPRAAQMWAAGQPVFAACKRFDSTPSVAN